MAIDNRILRVSVTINGQLKTYEGLAITAQGTKFNSTSANDCLVKIANISKEDRDFLSTEGTPYNRFNNRVRQKVVVEAGRESTGTSRVFSGDIALVTLSQPPDIWTTIKCITGDYGKGNVSATTGSATSSVRAIAARVAGELEVSLDFTATDKTINNYTYTGSATAQLTKIEELGNYDVSLDDDTLIVKDKATPLPDTVYRVSANTGMVGIPVFTDVGVDVKVMYDQSVRPGAAIEVVSEVYPATNGIYAIDSLQFDLANRDTPFYQTLKTRRISQ